MIRLGVALASILMLSVPAAGGAVASEPVRLSYSVGVIDGRNTYAGLLGSGLCLANARGGEGTRLTAPRAHDGRPAWSPDGRILAFHRSQGSGSTIRHGIYVQDEQGRTRAIAEASSEGTQLGGVASPAWSPDGRRIVFRKWGGYVRGYIFSALYTVLPDGSNQQQLTQADARYFVDAPAWSPRGDVIVFGRGTDLYLVDADGGNERLLVHDGRAPSWSPDGTSVVFSRDHNLTRSDLVIIGADGRGQHSLTSQPGEEENPAWSLDGEWIAFEQRAQCGPRCGGGLEGTDIAVIRPDGTDLHVLRGSSLAELYPAWRPPAPARPGAQRPCVIRGTDRANTIRGTPRGDLIVAGRGWDVIFARGGEDLIDDGPGPDRVFGGPGNDLFYADDGRRDILDGGRGSDEAYVDGFDRFRSIETLPPR